MAKSENEGSELKRCLEFFGKFSICSMKSDIDGTSRDTTYC